MGVELKSGAKQLSETAGGYVAELDGFRAIPMLFVMWGHFGAQYSHFWLPVQGFFVLSGFLISRILIKEKEKGLGFRPYFKTYWMRRVLRIFPVNYLYLGILLLLFLVFSYPADLMKVFLSLLTYTYNFYLPHADIDPFRGDVELITQHLWTLSVEEQFYLFLPILIYLASQKWLRIWTVVLIIGATLFRFFYGDYLIHHLEFPTATSALVRLNTFSHLDAFFMGVAINVFNLRRFMTNWWPWSIAIFLLLAAFGALNVVSHLGQFDSDAFLTHAGFHITWYQNYEHVWSYTLVNLGFMLCVLALLNQQTRVHSVWGRILRFPPLVLFGKLSYGMYVYHLLIYAAFSKFVFPERRPELYINVLWFIVYVAVVFGVSWLSYEYFEKRFLKKKPAYIPVQVDAESVSKQKRV